MQLEFSRGQADSGRADPVPAGGSHGQVTGGCPTAASQAAEPQAREFLVPGRNCSTIANAARAAVLVDGAEYFSWLEQALLKAQREVLILGWDFDGRIALTPQRGAAVPLGEFLRALVEERPELEVRILVWSAGVIHGPGAALPMLVGAPWQDHPRIDVRLDRNHPIYGAQHQKIVCIDDAVAFAGGMDLTVQRWDDREHRSDHPLRVTPDGETYPPVHDVQIAVDGEAARAVAGVARHRWRLATGEELPPVADAAPAWPEGLAPHFRNVPVGIACTIPHNDGAPVGDAARLTLDAISRARRTLYIESQYLTATKVEKALAERMASPGCPEIVIVLTYQSPGWIEQFVMGSNRDRLLRRLRRRDRYGRLGVYHAVVPGPEKVCDVKVHSKVIIADDIFLRVGSSNLNNRSIGLDSECDVAIEVGDEEGRDAIRRLRHELLAEHLGSNVNTVAQTVEREGSMIRAIERLNSGARGLRRFPAMQGGGPRHELALTWLLDPERPIRMTALARRWWRGLGAILAPWWRGRKSGSA